MAWAMPTQPWCNETSWVYLGSSSDAEGEEADCDDAQEEFSCLRLQFTIIPFQVGRTRGSAGTSESESMFFIKTCKPRMFSVQRAARNGSRLHVHGFCHRTYDSRAPYSVIGHSSVQFFVRRPPCVAHEVSPKQAYAAVLVEHT